MPGSADIPWENRHGTAPHAAAFPATEANFAESWREYSGGFLRLTTRVNALPFAVSYPVCGFVGVYLSMLGRATGALAGSAVRMPFVGDIGSAQRQIADSGCRDLLPTLKTYVQRIRQRLTRVVFRLLGSLIFHSAARRVGHDHTTLLFSSICPYSGSAPRYYAHRASGDSFSGADAAVR